MWEKSARPTKLQQQRHTRSRIIAYLGSGEKTAQSQEAPASKGTYVRHFLHACFCKLKNIFLCSMFDVSQIYPPSCMFEMHCVFHGRQAKKSHCAVDVRLLAHGYVHNEVLT